MGESELSVDEGVKVIIKKYLDGEISLTLASKLLNMNVIEFVNYLKARGIKPFRAEKEDLELEL